MLRYNLITIRKISQSCYRDIWNKLFIKANRISMCSHTTLLLKSTRCRHRVQLQEEMQLFMEAKHINKQYRRVRRLKNETVLSSVKKFRFSNKSYWRWNTKPMYPLISKWNRILINTLPNFRVLAGNASVYLPAIHFILLIYSPQVAEFIQDSGKNNLVAQNDYAFMKNVFNMLAKLFNLVPPFKIEEFFAPNTAIDRKVSFLLQLIQTIRGKH